MVLFLSGLHVLPAGVSLRSSVRLRDGEGAGSENRMLLDVFDHSCSRFPALGADPARPTWWFEFSDGRRAYAVDSAVREERHAAAAAAPVAPSRPELVGGGSVVG